MAVRKRVSGIRWSTYRQTVQCSFESTEHNTWFLIMVASKSAHMSLC